MKLLTGCLTLAAMLCCMPASQAEFLIDNFAGAADTGSTTTRGPVTGVGAGTLVFSPSGDLTVVAGAADAGLIQDPNSGATQVGSGFNLTYAIAASAPNPVGFGYFSTLELAGLTTVGDWAVTFATGNGSSPEGVSKTPVIIANGSTSASIDLYDNTHAANLNGLTTVNLFFRNLTDASGSRVLTLGSITAVPEPTSIALLGLTGLGGVVVLRRRKKMEASA